MTPKQLNFSKKINFKNSKQEKLQTFLNVESNLCTSAISAIHSKRVTEDKSALAALTISALLDAVQGSSANSMAALCMASPAINVYTVSLFLYAC